MVFDTPGFIAGYVRSYAKYLGLDPEKSFELFCSESGFTPVHGMDPEKALPKRSKDVGGIKNLQKNYMVVGSNKRESAADGTQEAPRHTA